MTRYAITADVHGKATRLQSVLEDARRCGATAFIDLGDVGTDAGYDLLRQAGAALAFGNYDASRWDRLSPKNQAWVRQLAPILVGGDFLAAHAAPYLPADLQNVDDILDYLMEHDIRWNALFPRLDTEENARWRTYAVLEEQDKRVFFHGHTHVQAAWRVGPSGAMARVRHRSFVLDTRGRYIVGVGSVGQPEDGAGSAYVIYDQEAQTVTLHRTTHRR